MRIGISCIVLHRNRRGFETYIRQLIKGLAELDKELEIYIYSDHELPEFENIQNVKVRVVANRIKNFFWRNISLPLCAMRDKIDIMHFPDNSVWLFPWKRTVVTLHDISPVICKKYHLTAWWMLILVRLIYWLIKQNAQVVITDSRSSKKDIDRYFGAPSQKVVSIPLYCNEEFRLLAPDVCRISTLDVDKGEQFVLFVGAIDPRKNLVNLVKAVEIVRKRWKKDVRLLIVGEYKRLKGLRFTRRKELIYHETVKDFVRMMGYMDKNKLVALYNMASVCVLPSFYEGFGLPVLEAMSCGTPVIVSDSDWGREITGDNALFVDPENVVDIAEKILIILKNNDIADSLRAKGLLHVKNYSAKITASKTLDVYKKIFGVV
ncbi:MAG: glycosyltransferase family 1 protein [Candidatus Auribacter fodinae]|jgi:glycosyltransferase involved in cell wall biosynthesis|uniref:Glycosyltransferase family 1 protein n=1 Tax=Candidatus Auribacter fodinae TaxID=2093366 RepID=A0A3A4R1Y7_9BACT|nr:MAG: glycosyltransferase family 1 protein [Candidatus Auribacter fodinae]